MTTGSRKRSVAAFSSRHSLVVHGHRSGDEQVVQLSVSSHQSRTKGTCDACMVNVEHPKIMIAGVEPDNLYYAILAGEQRSKVQCMLGMGLCVLTDADVVQTR